MGAHRIGLNTHELAWAAGFFDGEGCTTRSLSKSGTSKPPVLTLTQVDTRSLDRFHLAVGGLGRIRFSERSVNPRHRDTHVWVTTNWVETQAVIALLWRFLSPGKREQALRVFHRWLAERALRQERRLICRDGHAKSVAGERCRRCSVGQTLRWRAKNPERYAAYMREYGLRRTASGTRRQATGH